MGGPIYLPYRSSSLRNGNPVPSLRCESRWQFNSGDKLRFGLRLFGELSSVLPAIIEGVTRFGLVLGQSRFRLAAAEDCGERALYDGRFPAAPVQMPRLQRMTPEPEKARRIRIVFLTPTVYKPFGEDVPTFSPAAFAKGFLQHSIGRAREMCQTCSRQTVPKLPCVIPELVSERLFHYELPRESYRQDKSLRFDGMLGYMDLEGELDSAMPLARAAEVMYFGQKAAFGQGR